MIALGLNDLPALNATLNAASFTAVLAGLVCIKRRREAAHKKLMLLAVGLSAAFLVSYVIYHTNAPAKKFTIEGWVTAYRIMLFSHIVLAVLVVPLVLITVFQGLKDNRPKHRRIARWTVPIWMYVSVTGVLVYFCVHVWQ